MSSSDSSLTISRAQVHGGGAGGCALAQRVLDRVRATSEGDRRGGLILGVTLWIWIVGFFILVKSTCCVLFISTYEGLIAIRHVGGIPGREQEME